MTHLISPDTGLYNSQQIYQIEENWFAQGNPSFGLMQQASWQMAMWLNQNCHDKTACVWTGSGNNGGDGWLLAYYLHQFGWQVTVIQVAEPTTTDSKHAKKMTLDEGCLILKWQEDIQSNYVVFSANIHIDALFGIGLDRKPTGNYAAAIAQFNELTANKHTLAIAVDISSGLVASTGQVFDGVAIKADISLCLLAHKVGLFTKDGKGHAGQVKLFPLIPLIADIQPIATRRTEPYSMPIRQANTHKGSFGHVLIIGGNKTSCALDMGAQGMGGASILSASGAFAVGAGKVSVACHRDYQGAVLASKPNAMVVDLQQTQAVEQMFSQVSVVAIGMGLGRDEATQELFANYLSQAMQAKCKLVIDADGLYHLAHLVNTNPAWATRLQQYADNQFVAYTPHTGEMARLLSMDNQAVEENRVQAVVQAIAKFGGNWLLKGAGSIVYEAGQFYLCDVGNAGMATAGMGDVLSGMAAGLQAQYFEGMSAQQFSLQQAVLIHGYAGDSLANKVGQLGLQATDIADEVIAIIDNLSTS